MTIRMSIDLLNHVLTKEVLIRKFIEFEVLGVVCS